MGEPIFFALLPIKTHLSSSVSAHSPLSHKRSENRTVINSIPALQKWSSRRRRRGIVLWERGRVALCGRPRINCYLIPRRRLRNSCRLNTGKPVEGVTATWSRNTTRSEWTIDWTLSPHLDHFTPLYEIRTIVFLAFLALDISHAVYSLIRLEGIFLTPFFRGGNSFRYSLTTDAGYLLEIFSEWGGGEVRTEIFFQIRGTERLERIYQHFSLR